MKKIVSFTIIMLILTMLLTMFAYNYSYARVEAGHGGGGGIDDTKKDSTTTSDITSGIMGEAKKANTGKVQELGGKIVGVIQAIGTVVAIVMLLVVGITYMTKSPEGKAEYKKSMGNYIVGALLIFGATTVVSLLYSVANGLKNS